MTLEINIPVKAFHPKFCSMKGVVHPQPFATMITGGAAKVVKTPPTEMLVKSSPNVP